MCEYIATSPSNTPIPLTFPDIPKTFVVGLSAFDMKAIHGGNTDIRFIYRLIGYAYQLPAHYCFRSRPVVAAASAVPCSQHARYATRRVKFTIYIRAMWLITVQS